MPNNRLFCFSLLDSANGNQQGHQQQRHQHQHCQAPNCKSQWRRTHRRRSEKQRHKQGQGKNKCQTATYQQAPFQLFQGSTHLSSHIASFARPCNTIIYFVMSTDIIRTSTPVLQYMLQIHISLLYLYHLPYTELYLRYIAINSLSAPAQPMLAPCPPVRLRQPRHTCQPPLLAGPKT